MNHFQIKQKQQLEDNNSINYKEIHEILNAFQVASGQQFAIGKTKGILDFLKDDGSITIEDFNFTGKNIEVSDVKQLASIYKEIDQYIDLTTDKDFKQYF